MKKLCLILATFGILISCQEPKKTKPTMDNAKDALSVIHSRKSVREYTPDKQISKDDLETMVRAGMAAPSARDIRPWHFVIISEPAVMKELAEKLPYAKMLAGASAAIVVCGDTVESPQHWMVDCAAATQNILLAAEALGIGAVWTAGWPSPERIDAIRAAVNMPENVLPLNVIPMGYPAKEEQAKDKYDAIRIHWDNF